MKSETIYFDNMKRSITFIIGKNAQDNFDIIDESQDNDIWFHIENESSCHVIAKLSKELLLELDKKELRTIIKKGSLLCKENTPKYKKEKKVCIIYTFCKNIKKTNIIGCVETQNTKQIYV